MQDSVYYHKTRQNLNLLKSTLVSRPVKILNSQTNYESIETHNSSLISDCPLSKPKYINAYFKETSTYRLTPRSSAKKQSNSLLKAIEYIKVQPSLNNKFEKRPECRKSLQKIHRMPPLPFFHPSTCPNDLPIMNSNERVNITSINDRIPRVLTKSIVIPMKHPSSPLIDILPKEKKGKLAKESSLQEQISKKNTLASVINTNNNHNNRAFSSNSLNIKQSFENHQILPMTKKKTPKIKAKSWVVFETNTEKMLFSMKHRKAREIASLTKIMTCHLACFFIENYEINPANYYMKVPKAAIKLGGTSAELEHGDNISIKDLLFGMMLPSGNDAAYCLGNFFGKLAYILYQDEKNRLYIRKKQRFAEIYREKWHGEFPCKDFVKFFVCEMNKTARNNGLFNTIFNNPHGLSDKINKSTAEDIAKLSILALKSTLFKEIVNKMEYYCTIQGKDKEIREVCWRNTNELLNKGFNGIKTGNTPNAGPCFAASFERNGLSLVIVVLKTKSDDSRFGDTEKLLKWILKSRNENWAFLK